MGRETARALNEARETLAAWALRMAAANKRMVGLERELAAARKQLSRQESDLHSLETSLELSRRENTRLSERASNSSATAEKRTSQLAQTNLALKTAAAERSEAEGQAREQIAALNERIAALNIQLEAVTTRAAAAENLASETQLDLLALSGENASAQRRLAVMQTSLQEKEGQVQALRQAQLKLIDAINSREAALARAEERVASLAELFLQLEAKAATNAKEGGNVETAGERQERALGAAEPGAKIARPDCAMLKRDLENDSWLFGGRDLLLPS
jgi:chromosome segregation ATPase